jgi:NAD(P)-dependent dehydrogenase (short-subunit alcohol dehydrogenase family)
MNEQAKPPFPRQKQPMPGKTDAMDPVPDHGERSYRGSGRLAGKKAIITGADSGIGRAVAIAYAREGADVLIAYLNEHDDAKQTERFVKDAGRKAVLIAGDIQQANHCRGIVNAAMCNVLSHQGGRAAHAARQRHHQYRVDKFGYS